MWKRRPADEANSIAQLAARAGTGDREAFEVILSHYQPGLRRILLRRTNGNLPLAEELIQQTWIGVWEAFQAGRYDSAKAAISTFIYAVAHKLWLQHLRRSGRAPLLGGDIDYSTLMDSKGDLTPEPADEMHGAEMLEALRDCLHASGRSNSLTPEERRIVSGLAGGETERILANKLDLAPSTIHARKLSAYKKLRDCMSGKGYRLDSLE